MTARKLGVVIAIAALLSLLIDLYVGYYFSYVDHDQHKIYFVKKAPSFRSEFINPFANEADPLPVNQLSANVRKELSDFCTYTYGATSADEKSLDSCRVQILRDIQ